MIISTTRLRVLIADDHPIVRYGLRQILSETADLEVAGEAENGVQALQMVREQPWDVVVLDISMPGRNGIDTLKMIRKETPRLPVLILSTYPEDQYAVHALKAGAAGYLSKQSTPDQLVSAIRLAASGRRYVSQAAAEALANALSGNGDRPPHEKLSDREFQTLRLIACGRTPAQIAEALGISVKTVSVYRSRLLEKMGMRNNAELTHYGIRHGLTE